MVNHEPAITALLAMVLGYEGYTVQTASAGREALTRAADFRPALMLVDVRLPDIDGHEVLRRLALTGRAAPVIFLSSGTGPADRQDCRQAGRHEYLAKPIDVDDLVARVRSMLERHGLTHRTSSNVLRVAGLEMDDDAHEVRAGGALTDLTPTEYRLLRYLLLNKNQVLTRPQLLDHVWERDLRGDATVLETHICNLRRKLGRGQLLQTVRGLGYVLRDPAQGPHPHTPNSQPAGSSL